MSHNPSCFLSCFRPSPTVGDGIQQNAPPQLPSISTSANRTNTTSLYQTHIGIFSITWSSTILGHSVSLHLIDSSAAVSAGNSSPLPLSGPISSSGLSFNLRIKPFMFWKKRGSKKIHISNQENRKIRRLGARIYWDFSNAKFGSGSRPDPQSGFYMAVVIDGETILVVGDLINEAYSKTKTPKQDRKQSLILRREHVCGNRVYTTKARFGGKTREITIDCSVDSDARLSFCVDNESVLLIKRLKWKFRGNESIEIDGVAVQISWDVYNWFFDKDRDGHAVFMFRFENQEFEEKEEEIVGDEKNGNVQTMEWRKMRKNWFRTARSSSSSSISMSTSSASNSSACSSSVMEWVDFEEIESGGPINGFSLLIYAWKK